MASLDEAFKIIDQTIINKADSNVDTTVDTKTVVGTIYATTDPNKPTCFPNYAASIYAYDNGVLYVKDSEWFGFYQLEESAKDGDIIKTDRGVYGRIYLKDRTK